MALSKTIVWRSWSGGGVNTNGGGFDCSIASAATGTNGSFTGTTFTDAIAAAFTVGMVGSSINFQNGQYLITARISASQITLGSGNPALTIPGPIPWTVGGGQDYSQQNAAQASGTHGTAAGTATFTDLTAANFTAAMIGNAMFLTGTGFTTGWYSVVAFTSSTVVTLDRSPGTGTATGTWHLGGRWADWWTNPGAASSPVLKENIIYVLGSGVPNPSAYTYDYVAPKFLYSPPTEDGSDVVWANDPATSGYKAFPDMTGGMPCIQFTGASIWAGNATNGPHIQLQGLWFVAGSSTTAGSAVVGFGGQATDEALASFNGCVFDQFGTDTSLAAGNSSPIGFFLIGNEVFSSQGGTGGTHFAVSMNGPEDDMVCVGNNLHDCVGGGVNSDTTGAFNNNRAVLTDNIVAKCSGDGIYIDGYTLFLVKNNTVDGNAGNGISGGTELGYYPNYMIMNNIITNQTGGGKIGLTTGGPIVTGGPTLIDYQTYYNNTLNQDGGYRPHDTYGGANPYVNSAVENYTLV